MIYCDKRFVGLIKTCWNIRRAMNFRKDNRFVMSSRKLLFQPPFDRGASAGWKGRLRWMEGRVERDGMRKCWGPEKSVHTFSADPLCSAACTQVNNRTSLLSLVKLIGRWFDEGHIQQTSPASQLIRNKEEQRRDFISSKRGLPC